VQQKRSNEIRIHETEKSTEDVFEILQYFDEQSPALADDFLEEVQSRYKTLQLFPESGSLWELSKEPVRKLILTRFGVLIIYKYIHDQDVVILRVFHGSKNPENIEIDTDEL
jgi:plasmid stabilization system protein ParE